MSDLIGGRRVRGLTLTRPWPWAFLHAGKRVENRSWPAPRMFVGGWLALHAGKGYDPEAEQLMREGEFGDAARLVPAPAEQAHSVIVAVARVLSCVEVDGCWPRNDPWTFGPFVWKLADYAPLSEPVPCAGHQRLWKLPPSVFERVRAQVEAGV